jgi:hypothetical protein
MTRAICLLFLMAFPAGALAGVDEAERAAAKAQNEFYKAIRSGKVRDKAKIEQLRRKLVAPANEGLGRAVEGERGELLQRVEQDNRRAEENLRRKSRELEARKDPKASPRPKPPGADPVVAGAPGLGRPAAGRHDEQDEGESRRVEALDGSKVEKEVDMRDSKPRWKKVTHAPEEDPSPTPEGVVRRTDEEGVKILDFGGGGAKKKAK